MSFSQPSEKAEMLLGFLGYGGGVKGPGEVNTEEFMVIIWFELCIGA